MTDLVGTCPKDFWTEWIAEGDVAGETETGEEWGWYTRDRMALEMRIGHRFYVVAHGKLRGFAPVTRIQTDGHGAYMICRQGGALACTISVPVPGFRGLRRRWWNISDERPFQDWKIP